MTSCSGTVLIGESHNESQCDVETSDFALIEAAYEPPDPSSPNCDRFIGHYLGTDSQNRFSWWINRDSEVRSIHDLRRHLANHHRGLCFRKRASVRTITAGRGVP